MSDFFRFGSEYSAEYEEEGDQEEEDPSKNLAIDDSLPILERIKKYLNSEILLHRLYLIRSLPDFARQLGFEETKRHLIPILEEIIAETERSIRQALVEQLAELGRYFVNEVSNEESYSITLHVLVPMVAELTTDRNSQVRFSAADSFTALAAVVKQSDIEFYFFPIVKSLANDNTEEEHRLEAAQLLANLASLVDSETCVRLVVPLVTKLAEDPAFKIRKSITTALATTCRTVGDELTKSAILPVFIKLCGDEIWGVRKACAEVLVSIAESIHDISSRYNLIVPILDKLLEDQSRWVKGAANQCIGPFIAVLDSQHVDAKLLKYFTSMVNQSKPIGDSDLTLCCAFNFPAVILTIESARWGELWNTYITLVKDTQWRVRKSLAHSLHEIAKILGTDLTETSLLTTFEIFLKDIDEVKTGVISHVGDFLSVLSPKTRVKYLSILTSIQQSKNWRFRKMLAKQLDVLSGLYNSKDNHDYIFPILLLCCHDAYASVRKAASRKVGGMLGRLKRDNVPDYLEELILQLLQLAHHSSYSRRQLYLNVIENLVDNMETSPDLFYARFMPPLKKIAKDKVANVRLVLAQVLVQYRKSAVFHNNETLLELIGQLKGDIDRDVVEMAFVAYQTQIIPKELKPMEFVDTSNTYNNNNTDHNDNSNISITDVSKVDINSHNENDSVVETSTQNNENKESSAENSREKEDNKETVTTEGTNEETVTDSNTPVEEKKTEEEIHQGAEDSLTSDKKEENEEKKE